MLQFFEQIANLLSTVIDYIVDMFNSLLLLINYIAAAPASVSFVLSFFPTFITAPIIVILSVSLIINILNKGG